MPERHREFLASALDAWKAHPGILGVLAAGSYLSRSMDAFSDLDLVLVVSDALRATIAQERLGLARAAGPLLQGFTGEHVGEPRLLICLYGPPLLHVDLKFLSVAELDVRIEDPEVLFERGDAITLQALAAAVDVYTTLRGELGTPGAPQPSAAEPAVRAYLSAVRAGG
ncbi:MAG TPA: hypothetical protein VK539_07290 [Myxococcaceae bacterium]|nr:hypothetical protein [Myxococcaceae bacterium]